jgi:hypothetical protein
MFTVILSLLLTSFSGLPSFGEVKTEMYLGVENFITIKLNDCNPEDVLLKVNTGTLQQRTDSTYLYVPQNVQDEIKIKLYYKKVLCDVITVVAKMIPEPTLALEHEFENKIKTKDLLQPIKLYFVYPPAYPENNKSKMLSFSIILNDKNGNFVYSNTIKGEAIDEMAISHLKKLTAGSRISINNILTSNAYKGNSRYPINKEIMVID